MKASLSLVVVVIIFFVAAGRAQAVDSPLGLLIDCRSLGHTKGMGRQIRIPKTPAALLCWGYMQAMQDLLVWSDEDGRRIMGSCPPAKTTEMQLIQVFVKYARSHRRQLQGNTALAVMTAFQRKFPCQQDGAPSGNDDNNG